jgi:predicted PurR-regulated permease PerM
VPTLVTHTADRIVDAFSTRLPVNKEAIRTELIDRMKSASGYLLNSVGAAVGGAATVFLTAVLVTVFLYFLLRYGKDWVDRLAAPHSARSSHHGQPSSDDTRLYRGERERRDCRRRGAGTASQPGVLVYRVRSPALWGAVGGLASIIPVVGAPLVWVPVAIAYLLMGSYWKAVVLALWGSLVVGSVDNVLRPFVVGAREKQHPMLIALAAIGGTYAFGPMGILLGPLVVSLAAALLKEIQSLVSPEPTGELAARPAGAPGK